MKSLNKTGLYLKLIWNHIVFWSFPTPEEDYYLRIGTIYKNPPEYPAACSGDEWRAGFKGMQSPRTGFPKGL